MKLTQAVRELIRLGDASRAYWDRELPKHHPQYPVIRAGEDSVPSPPEDAQIKALLESLPEQQLYAVILLTYVGRGDFSADRLLPAYETVKEIFLTRDLAIAQIVEMNTLSEYLTDAMEEIRKRHIDLDSFNFESEVAIS